MDETIVVFVTCGSEEEALKIGRTLVEKHISACVNLVSRIRSIYHWEGKVYDENEWLMVIKTQKKRFEELTREIKSLHSYSVPEIIALNISEGYPPYLKWIIDTTEINKKDESQT